MLVTRNKKRRRPLTVLAVTAAVLLGACSTDDPGVDTASDATSPSVFTFNIGAVPISLDVTKHFDANVMAMMSLFTEPLERLASDGSTSPALAEKVSQPDDTTIVYTLRPDVTFSNGEPLTADDVAWSIEHVSDVEAGAQTATILKNVDTVTAKENTVTVTLKAPDPTVRGALALVGMIQNAKFAESKGDELGTPTAAPIGTGPYVVTQNSTEGITLERNSHYWGEAPAPDTVKFVFVTTDNAGQLALRSGDIQGSLVSNATSLPQWEAVEGATSYSAPMLMSNYFSLDTSTAPFDDLHVRKAMAHAIDREGLLKASFGGNAHLLSALTPAGELTSVAPSPEAVDEFLAGLPTYEFDMDKAKQELAQSAHPDGFEVTIPYIDELSWTKLTALNLQENLKPLGITVTPKPVTSQQWTADLFAHKTTEVWPMSFAAAIPDPGLLGRLITEDAITAPGGYNFAKWAPAELQDAAKTLTGSTDKDARWAATQQILTAIAEDVPYLPLFQPEYIVVLGGGYEFASTLGFIEFASGTWIHELTVGS